MILCVPLRASLIHLHFSFIPSAPLILQDKPFSQQILLLSEANMTAVPSRERQGAGLVRPHLAVVWRSPGLVNSLAVRTDLLIGVIC